MMWIGVMVHQKNFVPILKKLMKTTKLYHTYESSGVFEVTGTMFRVKVDEENNVIGVLKNKRFNLRISVNEGIDEDFQYFGSDGYSFIPFKNTLHQSLVEFQNKVLIIKK